MGARNKTPGYNDLVMLVIAHDESNLGPWPVGGRRYCAPLMLIEASGKEHTVFGRDVMEQMGAIPISGELNYYERVQTIPVMRTCFPQPATYDELRAELNKALVRIAELEAAREEAV